MAVTQETMSITKPLPSSSEAPSSEVETHTEIRYDRWSVYSLYAFAILVFGGPLYAAGF